MKVEFCRIKKAWIILVFALISTILIVTIIPPIVASGTQIARQKIVVIDAGHGGPDAGVVGKNTGIKESEINLKISLLVGEQLKGVGYKVVYTRTNDTMMKYNGIHNNAKRADMFARADIIDKANPDVVVSIHSNYYASQPSRRGAQVFFNKQKSSSREFASIMQEVLNDNINSENNRAYQPLCAEKFLLSYKEYCCIIVECGFLSNAQDEKALSSAEYQLFMAKTIATGIIVYIQNDVVHNLDDYN